MKLETDKYESESCFLELFDDIDIGKHDGLAAYFSQDAVFRFAQSRQDAEKDQYLRIQGPDGIADFLRATFSSLAATHHAISNLRTRIEDGTAKSSAHMRVYHQGAGPVAHLFEESLSVCDVTFAIEGGKPKIRDFNYIILIVLGTTDVFVNLNKDE